MNAIINGNKYDLGTSASAHARRNELLISSPSPHQLVKVNLHNAAAAEYLRELTEESFLDGEDVNINIFAPEKRGENRL